MTARRRSAPRKRLAAKAFARTAAYDAAIATGSPATLGDARRSIHAVAGTLRADAALWREPASSGGLLPHRRRRASASRPRASCRARSCATTISTIPTPPTSWSPSSTRSDAPPSPSSSMPIRAASRSAQRCRAYRKALRLRPGQRLRRHRRAEPHARRRGRARDRQDLHRGRSSRRTPSDEAQGDRRGEEEPAPAAGRRPARPARAGHDASARRRAAFSCRRATAGHVADLISRS